MTGIVAFAGVAALSFVIIVLAVSLLRFQNMMMSDRKEKMGMTTEQELSRCLITRESLTVRHQDPYLLALASPHWDHPCEEEGKQEFLSQLLIQYSKSFMGMLRQSDDVIVHEGSVALVIDADPANIRSISERLFKKLSAISFIWNGARVDVGWSLGFTFRTEDRRSSEELLAEAGKILEKAQGKGLNRYEVSELPEPESEADDIIDTAHDELTGLLSERRIHVEMQRFISFYRKNETPVTIGYLNVRGLSQYNEFYGHACGDALLKGTAEVLKKFIRDDDLAGRRGGVFLLALGCGLRDAERICQRLLAEFRVKTVSYEDQTLKTSVQIGLSAYPKHGYLPKLLMRRAELAMERAGDRGDNVYQVYSENMERQAQTEPSAEVF